MFCPIFLIKYKCGALLCAGCALDKMLKNKSFLSRFLFNRVEITLMPRYGGGVRFGVYPWIVIIIALLWAGITCYGIFLATRHLDYNITKADAKIMKTKLAMIAEELTRNRKYLKRTRDTDKQMRQMLGMKEGSFVNLPAGLEQGKESGEVSFKDIFEKRTQDIDENAIIESLKETTELAGNRLASFQEIAWFYANERNILDSTPSIRPSGGRISSGFGYRLSPFGTYIASYHYGLDFAGKANSPVIATADGVVRQTGWASGYGQAVLVDHGFGYSTLYGHLADILVTKGDTVKRGQVIARMGTTGRSTGIHVHYEVWKDGVAVNPRGYFK